MHTHLSVARQSVSIKILHNLLLLLSIDCANYNLSLHLRQPAGTRLLSVAVGLRSSISEKNDFLIFLKDARR